MHVVDGPQLSGAKEAFVEMLLERLVELHAAAGHWIHTLACGEHMWTMEHVEQNRLEVGKVSGATLCTSEAYRCGLNARATTPKMRGERRQLAEAQPSSHTPTPHSHRLAMTDAPCSRLGALFSTPPPWRRTCAGACGRPARGVHGHGDRGDIVFRGGSVPARRASLQPPLHGIAPLYVSLQLSV